ncbi:hypothetical protein J437_LFUL011311 [Ladona fulva]|uniref:Transposase n=1 Tax=Ladona fulva TaxID=123851 RepID=A0A8K0KA49_LADFU|nr:hypothetical protein J437_LFUL011311 [Ladona fulva]
MSEERPPTEEEVLSILASEFDDFAEDSDLESEEESEEEVNWDNAQTIIFEPEIQLVVSSDPLDLDSLVIPTQDQSSTSIICGENRPDVPYIPGASTEKPFDYFQLFFTDNLLDFIIEETNRNAENILLNSPYPRARIASFRPVSRGEMETFFGLIYLMGLIQLPAIADYWRKTESLYDFPVFRETMSRDRFLIILRALHFGRNSEEGDPQHSDPLYKILPLLTLFSSKMREIYSPGKDLCRDESMLLLRGRLSFKQIIKEKRHKYGIKLYLLAEANGLILDVLIHLESRDHEVDGRGHAEKVVRKLMEGRLGTGYSLFINNSSVNLCSELLEEDTHMTGTLKKSRKDNPSEVAGKKHEPGDSIYRFLENSVCVLKWFHRMEVLVISSDFGPEMTETRKREGTKVKPKIIVKCNKQMGGTDRPDQYLSYYPLERKTLRWYLKVGLHVFHVMANNSWILHKKCNPDSNKISLQAFRELIAQTLIKKNKPATLNRPLSNPSERVHCLLIKNRKEFRKYCRECYKKSVRRNVTSTCDTCVDSPGLCVSCFRVYHNY